MNFWNRLWFLHINIHLLYIITIFLMENVLFAEKFTYNDKFGALLKKWLAACLLCMIVYSCLILNYVATEWMYYSLYCNFEILIIWSIIWMYNNIAMKITNKNEKFKLCSFTFCIELLLHFDLQKSYQKCTCRSFNIQKIFWLWF